MKSDDDSSNDVKEGTSSASPLTSAGTKRSYPDEQEDSPAKVPKTESESDEEGVAGSDGMLMVVCLLVGAVLVVSVYLSHYVSPATEPCQKITM